MKQKVLKTIALGLMAMVGVSAWAEDVVETLTATQDGWARYDNSVVNYNVAANSQIEVRYFMDSETNKSFYGLLCFDVPAKSGYKVKSAVLRFVTKKIAADRTTNFYKLGTDISTSPSFSDLSGYITTALATDAIGTVIAEGQNGKQISSDNVDVAKYQTITLWQNSITLNASAVTAGEKLNLLIATATTSSSSNGNRFFGKNAEGFTNSNISLTCTSDELVPKLTVTYEEDLDVKSVVSTPTADTFLRLNNSDNNGTKTYIEMENSSTTDFLGLMSFSLTPQPGWEIQSATLRLVTKRVKSSRATVSLYTYTGTWAEDAKYANQTENIIAARATTSIVSFTPEGQLNKDVSSDEITETKYQTIGGWQNSIDLTSYVKSLTATTFSIMIDADADKGQLQFFSKEATGFTNSKTAIENTTDDLVPQLVIVYRKMDSYKLPVTSAGAATLCLPFASTIPDGVSCYTLAHTDGQNVVTATPVATTLPANTPVLINAEENAEGYEFVRTGEIVDGTTVSGALTGVYSQKAFGTGEGELAVDDHYILNKIDDNVGFYKAADGKKVGVYKAYLTATNVPAGARLSIVFDNEETTAIKGVANSQKPKANGQYYDLQGRRVAQPTKGLYIVNGKKVVIK